MTDLSQIHVVLIDGPTAAALSQVLPVLLLTLMVELRRTELHRSRRFRAPLLVGVFFGIFGLIETVLVLSIDGAFFPFRWIDLIAALVIFGLLAMLFTLSLRDSPSQGREDQDQDQDQGGL